MTKTVIAEAIEAEVATRGWQPGTRLENMVILALPDGIPRAVQQFKVGRFRLDFAWPEQKIALEADGWHHRSPDGAASDRRRDSYLRSLGWVVFRVDDEHGEESLRYQVGRVAEFLRPRAACTLRYWNPYDRMTSPGDRL